MQTQNGQTISLKSMRVTQKRFSLFSFKKNSALRECQLLQGVAICCCLKPSFTILHPSPMWPHDFASAKNRTLKPNVGIIHKRRYTIVSSFPVHILLILNSHSPHSLVSCPPPSPTSLLISKNMCMLTRSTSNRSFSHVYVRRYGLLGPQGKS